MAPGIQRSMPEGSAAGFRACRCSRSREGGPAPPKRTGGGPGRDGVFKKRRHPPGRKPDRSLEENRNRSGVRRLLCRFQPGPDGSCSCLKHGKAEYRARKESVRSGSGPAGMDGTRARTVYPVRDGACCSPAAVSRCRNAEPGLKRLSGPEDRKIPMGGRRNHLRTGRVGTSPCAAAAARGPETFFRQDPPAHGEGNSRMKDSRERIGCRAPP